MHVSLLATQTVDQAMVEQAENLRQQFGEQIPPEELQVTNAKTRRLIMKL